MRQHWAVLVHSIAHPLYAPSAFQPYYSLVVFKYCPRKEHDLSIGAVAALMKSEREHEARRFVDVVFVLEGLSTRTRSNMVILALIELLYIEHVVCGMIDLAVNDWRDD